jgi:hypothetical protein
MAAARRVRNGRLAVAITVTSPRLALRLPCHPPTGDPSSTVAGTARRMASVTGSGVLPTRQLAQAFRIDSFRLDPDTDTRAERAGRYRVVQAEHAAVVRRAAHGHLESVQRNPELGRAHGDRGGVAARVGRPQEPPGRGSRAPPPTAAGMSVRMTCAGRGLDTAAQSALEHRDRGPILGPGRAWMAGEVLLFLAVSIDWRNITGHRCASLEKAWRLGTGFWGCTGGPGEPSRD